MAKCEVCGNCAIHRMAPTCAHCGCKVVGHGVEAGGDCVTAWPEAQPRAGWYPLALMQRSKSRLILTS